MESRHIKSVSRDSAGFELFDQMMDQAYTNGHKPSVKAKMKLSILDRGMEGIDQPEENEFSSADYNPRDQIEYQDDSQPPEYERNDEDMSSQNDDSLEPDVVLSAADDDGEAEVELAPIQSNEATHHKRQKKTTQLAELMDDNEPTGLRRSKRRHYRPLEYWRQERVVWGRRENGRSVVPVIKEIITIPKPDPEPLGVNRRKRGARKPRSMSLPSPVPIQEEVRIVEVDNPELGWDDATPSAGVIIDWTSSDEVERRVVYPARMVKPSPAPGYNYLFQKIFGDGDFIAAGQLLIPPGAEKPTKPTKDNTYIFYVIEGAIECKIHRTSFILSTGGTFIVPRGNQYYIKNICSRDVKLFFTQARKVPADEVEVPSVIRPRASTAPRPQPSE
ncbi:hypothetical protein Clacol_009847 [Clathrus columnatus]|uniref:CENP-C homolog n=1 Tax=Clathrus columnatus TaxID=1419009 RepID=A0AAV5ALT1_9AGAM|nr:hypothetical protein Clacol_009847 [Clathrus columnatus]